MGSLSLHTCGDERIFGLLDGNVQFHQYMTAQKVTIGWIIIEDLYCWLKMRLDLFLHIAINDKE